MAEASRRSVARTGHLMPKGDGRMASNLEERQAKSADVDARRESASRTSSNPRERRDLVPPMEGKKGGPGRRRPSPKKAGPKR